MTDTTEQSRGRHRLRWSVGTLAAGAAMAALLVPASADELPPPAPDPFERVAFVARNDVAVDALAAGPIAGALGAPIFVAATDPPLNEFAAQGLTDFAPDLVIIAGGPAAISPAVEDEVEAACGCTAQRAAGAGRDETAKEIADLIDEFGFGRPLLTSTGSGQVVGDAFLGGKLTVDALDVEKPFDADTLGGKSATEFAAADHDHRQTVTRTYVCSGVDFVPFRSTLEWRHQNNNYVALGIADDRARCPLHLPDGAIIRSVQFTLIDNHTAGRFDNISLQRGTASGAGVLVASETDPGGATNADTPGLYTATLDAIDETVDTTTSTYVAHVGFVTTANEDGGLQIVRATVNYEVNDSPMGDE